MINLGEVVTMAAVVERRLYDFQHVPLELRQLIEEEHAMWTKLTSPLARVCPEAPKRRAAGAAAAAVCIAALVAPRLSTEEWSLCRAGKGMRSKGGES
jgi:hypothetical protein